MREEKKKKKKLEQYIVTFQSQVTEARSLPQELLHKRWSWEPSPVLWNQARENLKYLHRFLVCLHISSYTYTRLEGNKYAYCREWTSKTWLKHIKALQSSIASKKVIVIHHKGHQKEDAEVTQGKNKADATAGRVAPELVTWQLSLMP